MGGIGGVLNGELWKYVCIQIMQRCIYPHIISNRIFVHLCLISFIVGKYEVRQSVADLCETLAVMICERVTNYLTRVDESPGRWHLHNFRVVYFKCCHFVPGCFYWSFQKFHLIMQSCLICQFCLKCLICINLLICNRTFDTWANFLD